MPTPFDSENPFPDGSLEAFAKGGPPEGEAMEPEEGVEVSLLTAAKDALKRLGAEDPEVQSLVGEIDAFLAKEGAGETMHGGEMPMPPAPAPVM